MTKKRNQPDATLRNVRKSRRDDASLRSTVKVLRDEVESNTRDIFALAKRVRALERRQGGKR